MHIRTEKVVLLLLYFGLISFSTIIVIEFKDIFFSIFVILFMIHIIAMLSKKTNVLSNYLGNYEFLRSMISPLVYRIKDIPIYLHFSLIYGVSVFSVIIWEETQTFIELINFFLINLIVSLLIEFPLIIIILRTLNFHQKINLINSLSLLSYFIFLIYLVIVSLLGIRTLFFITTSFDFVFAASLIQLIFILQDPRKHQIKRKQVKFILRVEKLPVIHIIALVPVQKLAMLILLIQIILRDKYLIAMISLLIFTVGSVYYLFNKTERIQKIYRRLLELLYLYAILSTIFGFIPDTINSFFTRILFTLDHDFLDWDLIFDVFLIYFMTGLEFALLLSKHYMADMSNDEINKLLKDDASSLYPDHS